jgi:hypothetical protein
MMRGIVNRSNRGWTLLAVAVGVLVGLLAPAVASASITQVFGTVTCTEQTSGATTGQRFCGNTSNTTVKTFDGTPIDIAMGFPVASGSDNNYPVVGIFHGWGGSKITPSSATAQRWLTKGYAVFSITDRGWGSSCGGPSKPVNTEKASPCEKGYIHLMARAYEVRDVQTLLGKLADEGVIDPQRIGATGGSYGGGMSLQLGSLKDRVELPNHELIPWESPGGKPMKIAATAPEFPWTDLSQALMPNGSGLDFAANSPYKGMLGDHRFGIEKQNWNASLYNAGLAIGYYGPESDPEANLTGWHNFDITGGPYDGGAAAIQQEEQLPYHSPYYTNLSEPPAPSLMENGWNDDLFPVDETVRYYNKVRAAYPNEAMKIFDLDVGHNPRSATTVSTGDVKKFQEAQNAWFAYFVKGEGSEPAESHGGVTAITSFCPQTAGGSGTELKAANWASLAPGEIRFSSAAEQTIQAPGTAPTTAFTSGTICTTQAAGDNASAATYKLGAAPASGFTIAGSPTVIAELSTPAANDQVIARLYDVNVPGGGTQQLIGRQTYRPLNPGEGFTKQTFQLHPQAWTVASGHVVKLELLTQDSTYARTSSSPHSVQVKNLELRLPTADAPGSAEGLVQAPLAKYLPPGFTLARNVVPAAPGAPGQTGGTNPNGNGVLALEWAPTQAATAPSYTLQHENNSGGWSNVATGLASPAYAFTAGSPEGEGTWTYRATESNESSAGEPSAASAEIKVDKSAPNAPTASADRAPDYGGGGGWYKDTVEVSFTSNGDPLLSDGSAGSGVDPASLPSPQTFSTDGSHEASGTVADKVGNVSAPGTLTVHVDASAPSVEVTCPATVFVGSTANATITAADGQSGLAVDPSGSVGIDTSKAGERTTKATAVDNVGHEASGSCTTQVIYPNPGPPTLAAGSNPNASGLFALAWTGADPLEYFGLSYTLQHHNAASEEWSNVASGLVTLGYEFGGSGEEEGTWNYRVQGTDPSVPTTTEWSSPSAPIKVDKTPPAAPTASADRAPDYAGGGGWYKDTVTVSFADNGDPLLADGSAGSGVNPSSLTAPQTFNTDGSHEASGTVADKVGNVSAPGALTVQVDASAPTVKASCPPPVSIGATGVNATVTASDGQSGLAVDPSGSYPINTSTAGTKTVKVTAVDHVGHETTASCSTLVGYTQVITGNVGKTVVKSGQAVELTSTAKVSGELVVKAGGALDVEGATVSGSLKAAGAALIRVCGATITGVTAIGKGTGSVVMGEGNAECPSSTFHGTATVKENQAGVLVRKNTFLASLKVVKNAGGVTVIENTISGELNVTGNTGTVIDKPNSVEGKSKLQ